MDFQSLVTKENFKAILHLHLKRQIQAKFSSIVLKDIHTLSDTEITSSDSAICSISKNLAQSDSFKEFSNSFLNDLDHLFNDKEKYVPKEDCQGTVSQCSSASSVNTTIDYISFDQFQDTIHLLLSGVNAEKLEALETFSRLPSLEHIIKQSLWPSVETGLHDALLSNVFFLRDASLKVYTRMLSSSEPKVVQESYNSLIKHVVHNLLPSMNQNDTDFIHKCKSVVEIVAILNKFLQNIPNHWLRYPQQVIENITVQSISILSYGSQHSKVFPIWLCVALCDQKSKWLSNILHGHLSRAYLIDALQKDPETVKLALQFCDNFIKSDRCLSWNSCCQNSAEVAEITHIVCFLAHLLRYSQGQLLFSDIYHDVPYPLLDCFDLLLRCTYKLCSISCISCCKVACTVLSKIVYHIWQRDSEPQHLNLLVKMLLNFDNFENLSENSLWFITMCFCHIPSDVLSNTNSSETQNMVLQFISSLFLQLSNSAYDIPATLPETSLLLNASLTFVKQIVSEPSNLMLNSSFLLIFSSFINKISDFSKLILSGVLPGLKTVNLQEIAKDITQLLVMMLQKPYCLSILLKNELLESTINVILEKILEDIKSKKFVCQRDISILSNALNYTFLTKSILNKSIIFKLSSVIWQFDTSNLQTLPKVKLVLETLVPSIFSNVFQSEILLDESVHSSVKLFQHVLLFPSLTNPEFFMQEEYILLSLQIISMLTCSVFSVCYLEANYMLSELLFELQNNLDETDCIIDSRSLIQNHILVKLNTVGGDKEKVLPPETLSSVLDFYNWPFFTKYPVPEVYYPSLSVEESTSLDETILVELIERNIKDIFLECIEDNTLSHNMMSFLLNASLATIQNLPDLSEALNFISLDSLDNVALPNEIVIGLKLTTRYGKILHLTKDDDKTIEKLLTAGKCLLGTENKKEIDLFVCTIALMFKFDAQASLSFLENLAKSPISLFIWHERMLQATEQSTKYASVLNIILEYCDMIVKQILPDIYSAFQFSKMLPSVLFSYWIRHCFWNYLNFSEISHFVLSVLVLGEDFAIYFFVSLLKHEQNFILKNALSCNIVSLLQKKALSGYKIKNYVSFINELSNTYKSQVLKSVSDVLCENSVT